jgi:serine/threonine-protein kinase HipA
MTYSYNPNVASNTNRHQMSVNGKREMITRTDLIQFAAEISLKHASTVIDEVVDAVSSWEALAKDNGLSKERIMKVSENLNLGI